MICKKTKQQNKKHCPQSDLSLRGDILWRYSTISDRAKQPQGRLYNVHLFFLLSLTSDQLIPKKMKFLEDLSGLSDISWLSTNRNLEDSQFSNTCVAINIFCLLSPTLVKIPEERVVIHLLSSIPHACFQADIRDNILKVGRERGITKMSWEAIFCQHVQRAKGVCIVQDFTGVASTHLDLVEIRKFIQNSITLLKTFKLCSMNKELFRNGLCYQTSSWPKALKIFFIKDSVISDLFIRNQGIWSQVGRRNEKVKMTNR